MKDFCETVGCLHKPSVHYHGMDLCRGCFYEHQSMGDVWKTKKVEK
jgi:hypothetical protein